MIIGRIALMESAANQRAWLIVMNSNITDVTVQDYDATSGSNAMFVGEWRTSLFIGVNLHRNRGKKEWKLLIIC